jgi:hypothetical protein
MNVTTQQAERLTRVYAEFGSVLTDLGILEGEPKLPVEPQWLRDTAKQWKLLSALVTDHNGDVGSEEWSRLGREHGYDPRGLGGFFVGSQPLMASQGTASPDFARPPIHRAVAWRFREATSHIELVRRSVLLMGGAVSSGVEHDLPAR